MGVRHSGVYKMGIYHNQNVSRFQQEYPPMVTPFSAVLSRHMAMNKVRRAVVALNHGSLDRSTLSLLHLLYK